MGPEESLFEKLESQQIKNGSQAEAQCYRLTAGAAWSRDMTLTMRANNNDLDEGLNCVVCERLAADLRSREQERREALDRRNLEAALPLQTRDDLLRGEELFISKMKILDRNRNAALDVLAEHQRLEHPFNCL